MSPVDPGTIITLAGQLASIALQLLAKVKQQEGLTNDQLFDRAGITNADTRKSLAAFLASLE